MSRDFNENIFIMWFGLISAYISCKESLNCKVLIVKVVK